MMNEKALITCITSFDIISQDLLVLEFDESYSSIKNKSDILCYILNQRRISNFATFLLATTTSSFFTFLALLLLL
jgi:hypothetical protein